ncbi:MAG: hypothetical protein IH987_07410, partial [Planctomycetes bacterium]|nr:hypothetical protein [Planctomycetota bacterium]
MTPTPTSNTSAAVDRGALSLGRVADGTLELRLSGRWCLGCEMPAAETVDDRLNEESAIKCITFDVDGISEWDSGLLAFLLNVIKICERHNVQMDRDALLPGVRRLLTLATAVPEQKGTRGPAQRRPLLVRIGDAAIGVAVEGGDANAQVFQVRDGVLAERQG